MGKIKGWKRVENGTINGFYEWQNIKTKQRVNYRPYTLGNNPKYKVIIEGVEEGIVSNKHSANFAVMNYMRRHPDGN